MALTNQLVGEAEHFSGRSYQRLAIACLARALSELDGAVGGELPRPVPALATVHEVSREGEARLELFLEWVEKDFDVTGFYITDQAGHTTDCPTVFSRDGAAREFLRLGDEVSLRRYDYERL